MAMVPKSESERVAIAILSVWEEGAEPALRIRITRIDRLSQTEPESTVVTSIEAASRLIAEWLRAFAHSVPPSVTDR
jgi:hypothetical protein